MTTPYGAPISTPLPEAPLSINFRVPEIPGSPQLTVRAGNGVELAGLTEDVARNGLQLGRALTEFRAGVLAGSGIPDTASSPQPPAPVQAPSAAPAPYQAPPQQPAQQWSAQPPAQPTYQAPQTGATGPAPTCPHGTRAFKSGVSQKNGRPYRMWVCPAPQSDPSQCKPEFAN
jgi:hypothetical protein